MEEKTVYFLIFFVENVMKSNENLHIFSFFCVFLVESWVKIPMALTAKKRSSQEVLLILVRHWLQLKEKRFQ